MSRVLIAALALCATATLSHAMEVKLGGGWDGKKVPAGQQCVLHGGKGSTPPMVVSGVPAGAAMIVVEFNDKSYAKLSTKGGHGRIGFPVTGATTKLPAVPGMTNKLPGGAIVVKAARSTGQYASKGYLPPCSGGRGNRYTADVKAVDAKGKVLKTVTVDIGKY